jgi:hypothetical protein
VVVSTLDLRLKLDLVESQADYQGQYARVESFCTVMISMMNVIKYYQLVLEDKEKWKDQK